MSKEQILIAAAQIFRSKGFHAASMRDIAAAVDLQKPSLYHHFLSKQEILFELLNYALDLLIERMKDVVSQPLPAEEKLSTAIHTCLEFLTDHADLAGVLLLEYRSLEPELRARHILRRDQFEDLWFTILKEGIDNGVFSIENPVLTTRAILGVLNWTTTWYHPGGALTTQQISSLYIRLFLNGLSMKIQEKETQEKDN